MHGEVEVRRNAFLISAREGGTTIWLIYSDRKISSFPLYRCGQETLPVTKIEPRSYSPTIVTILTENCAQGNTANVYNKVEFRFKRKIPVT